MRLTLDYDNMTFTKFMKKIRLIRIMFPRERIAARKSSSRTGYHVMVYGLKEDFASVLRYRWFLGDDLRRIKFDSQRFPKKICSQILFDKKRGKEVFEYV